MQLQPLLLHSRVTLRRMKWVILVVCCVTSVLAQQVAVSKQNRTITISADETIKVDPDFARLAIGREDYGSTQEQAFQATKEAITKVIDSLRHDGVAETAISTDDLVLEQQSDDGSGHPVPAERRFHSSQKLQVLVSIKAAQIVLDDSVAAGANEIGSPQWLLRNYDMAQAEAAGAALKKARLNAEQMATGLGAKLGQLVYASNTVPSPIFAMRYPLAVQTVNATVGGGGGGVSEKPLKLFAQPVEVKATVYATFSIE